METIGSVARESCDDERITERGMLRNTAYYISRWKGNRGKGPKNYQRRDSRIEEDINERLLQDPWLDAREITVTVRNGELFLNGSVPDPWSAHRAGFHAENVSGVQVVKNLLRAGPTDGNQNQDADFPGNEQTQLQSFRENLKGSHSP